jgi:heme/copper-type cytochrome/quinol oxidase subunit 4
MLYRSNTWWNHIVMFILSALLACVIFLFFVTLSFVQAILHFSYILGLKEHSNKLISSTSVIVKSFLDDEVISQIRNSSTELSRGVFSFVTAWKWHSRYSSASELWQLTVRKIDFRIVAFIFNLLSRRLISVCQYDWFPPLEVANGFMLYVIQKWYLSKFWHCVM